MSNTAKKERFAASQVKKSQAAGLRRIPSNDEQIVTCDFIGTVEGFLNLSIGVCTSYGEARQNMIDMLLIGSMKLVSGEEVRNYVPKDYK